MATSRLSLCMIVKNEAGMLAECLASAKPVVDELIVVDTGSTDGTRELAVRAGARVFDMQWADDFSAARNESISHATGDWVLWLDADERLAPGAGRAMRKALSHASFDCGMLRLHDASRRDAKMSDVLAGVDRLGDVQRVPRLLRRTPDLKFRGVIHEDVGPWLASRGMKVGAVDVDILHLGASAEVYESKDKFERNVRLLKRLIAESPGDPTAHGYLAHQYIERGLFADAARTVEEGWSLLHHVANATGYKPSILRLLAARARLLLLTSDFYGLKDSVRTARLIEGEHPDFDVLEGLAFERIALSERDNVARDRYARAALHLYATARRHEGRMFSQCFVQGSSMWAAWTRSGVCELMLGDVERAEVAFDRALTTQANHLEAKLGKIECTLLRGDASQALSAVEPHLNAHPDAWLLAASAAEKLGAIDIMWTFVVRAGDELKKDYISPHRAELHADLVAATAIYRGQAMASRGFRGAIGAVISRSAPHPGARPVQPSDASAVRTLVRNAFSLGRGTTLAPLLEPRAEVMLPGIHRDLASALESFGISLAKPSPIVSMTLTATTEKDAHFVEAILAGHEFLEDRTFLVRAIVAEGVAGAVIVTAERQSSDEDSTAISETLELRLGELYANPKPELERLFAFLGEAVTEATLRLLLTEQFPTNTLQVPS